MDFFDAGAELGTINNADVEGLKKSLSAGYGTDAAAFTGGRAIIPENCETEVQNLLAMKRQDCKILNTIKKDIATSTVHEVPQRIDEGDYEFLAIKEGEEPASSAQQLRRKTWEMKYLGCKRGVTRQMEIAKTFEGALASEKIAGTDSVIKGLEHMMLCGDSSVVPAEFDSFEASIRKAPAAEQNLMSLRGKHLKDAGEKAFDEIAMMCRMNGGTIDKAIFPLTLSKDVKFVMWDKFRFAYHNPNEPLPSYATASGAKIDFDGANAGGDKFYSPKGPITAKGSTSKRPSKPASVVGVAVTGNDAKGSEFLTDDDAGAYKYTVHAINQYGISEGTDVTVVSDATTVATVTVAKDGGAKLTITAGTGNEPTGYIICRSKKGGTEVMEMTRIAVGTGTTTDFVDLNHDLPGTASMLFLPNQEEQAYMLTQLMPISTIPLPYAPTMEQPFLVAFFGALEVRAPQYCGLIKDIGYDGGLY